jgi:hypothetical protein
VAWVRSLPCLLHGHAGHVCERSPGAEQLVEAHHAGKRPHNRKADDRTCIPLCGRAHSEWNHGSGWCKDMDKYDRREWAAFAVAKIQMQYALRPEWGS